MKGSGKFLMPRDDDMGQQISPTDKPGWQEPKGDIISILFNNEIISVMHTVKEDN